jgi:hypothetical protein
MLREYKDTAGTIWRVWDVYPSGRGGSASAPHHSFVDGWLCFESATEKRRLAPIPPDWELCDCARLQDLCGRAGHVTPTGSQPGIPPS